MTEEVVPESGFDSDLEAILNTANNRKWLKDQKISESFLRVLAIVHVAQELRDLNKTMKEVLAHLQGQKPAKKSVKKGTGPEPAPPVVLKDMEKEGGE